MNRKMAGALALGIVGIAGVFGLAAMLRPWDHRTDPLPARQDDRQDAATGADDSSKGIGATEHVTPRGDQVRAAAEGIVLSSQLPDVHPANVDTATRGAHPRRPNPRDQLG